MGKRTDVKFGTQLDDSKHQPTDDKPSLKGAWLWPGDPFKFSIPLKYLQNSLKFCILVRHVMISIGITNCPLRRRSHGHVTSLNFGK